MTTQNSISVATLYSGGIGNGMEYLPVHLEDGPDFTGNEELQTRNR